jgi:energy-coupling factor transport system permease protein
VAAACIAGACVLASRLAAQGLLLGVLLAAFAGARLPVRLLARGLGGAVWLLAFVAVANGAWFLVTRQAGWAHGEAAVHTPAELAVLLARLCNLLLLAVLFTATTVPVDAAEGFERLLRPLRRLRLPVHEIGMLLVLALSFVPIFLREAHHLADAHRMKRGLRRWGWRDRGRAVVPLLVPLFLSVLRRADELAVAMDARCFEPGAARSSLVPGRFGAGEAVTLATGALALAVGVWA